MAASAVQVVRKHRCWNARDAFVEGCFFLSERQTCAVLLLCHLLIRRLSESVLFCERKQLKSSMRPASHIILLLFDFGKCCLTGARSDKTTCFFPLLHRQEYWLPEKYQSESWQSYHPIVFGCICPTELGSVKPSASPQPWAALACCSQDHGLAKIIICIAPVCSPRASYTNSSDKRPDVYFVWITHYFFSKTTCEIYSRNLRLAFFFSPSHSTRMC